MNPVLQFLGQYPFRLEDTSLYTLCCDRRFFEDSSFFGNLSLGESLLERVCSFRCDLGKYHSIRGLPIQCTFWLEAIKIALPRRRNPTFYPAGTFSAGFASRCIRARQVSCTIIDDRRGSKVAEGN